MVNTIAVLAPNHIQPGTQVNGAKSSGGNHPPKNMMTARIDTSHMAAPDFERLLEGNFSLVRRVISILGRRLRYMGKRLSSQNGDVAYSDRKSVV